MTELQLGLIGLGVSAVIGVFAYNKWQEARHRKLASQVLGMQHKDVLLDPSVQGGDPDGVLPAVQDTGVPVQLDLPVGEGATLRVEPTAARERPGERIEPVLEFGALPDEPVSVPEPAAEVALPEEAPPAERVHREPDPVPPPRVAEDARALRSLPEPVQWVSPHVDYVVALHAAEPVRAALILDAQRAVLSRLSKPVTWVGYNETACEWERLEPVNDAVYRYLRVGLQLVDRRGPTSEAELNAFHSAMEDLADQLMAMIEAPARQAALETARALDAFCASVDIQIGINVVAQGQAFPGTKLRALAESAGMTIDARGQFVRHDDEGNVLFVLINHDPAGFSAETMRTTNTQGVTFLLDVPRVSHGERLFNQLVDLARRFADVLKGAVVDDNRRPLSEGAMEPIRRQIVQYQGAMAAQGLPAGAFLAQRLFS